MDHTEEAPKIADDGMTPDADDATAIAGNQQVEETSTKEPVDNAVNEDNVVVTADEGTSAPTDLVPEDDATTKATTIDATDVDKNVVVAEEDKTLSQKPPTAPTDTTDTTDTSSPTASKDNNNNNNNKKTSAFRQLVKSWETYIADANNADTFQPMQVLQSLGMCGTGHETYQYPRLTLAPSTEFTNQQAEGQDPFEPIILRHTHSTPLQYRPSFFTDDDNNSTATSDMPPPSQLDATRRSSSTPSRGSAFQQFNGRSTFGSHLRSASNTSGRSAFGYPFHRSSFSGVSTESNIRSSAFNPIHFSLPTTEEEPPQGEENTAIEVMDLGRSMFDSKPPAIDETEEHGEVEVQLDTEASDLDLDQVKPKKSAKARAARFLSDVGVLRRKKKGSRGGIVSVISCDHGGVDPKVGLEESGNDSDPAANQTLTLDNSQEGDSNDEPTMYQQLDSDADDSFDRYQSIENTGQDSEDSPRTVPSPEYQPMEEDQGNLETVDSKESGRPAVQIRVSCAVSRVPEISARLGHLTINNPTSPSPEDHSGSPTSSANSPGGATRSSGTTTTSGHTTQATSTTSAGTTSQISETDREVMEAMKEAKRRRRQGALPEVDKLDSDGSATIESSSSNSSATNTYTALSGSPGPLRDGASVVADRFFRNSKSSVPHGGYPSCNTNSTKVTSSVPLPYYGGAYGSGRAQTLPRKGYSNGSPTLGTMLNSIGEQPPIFVSYLDRQAASDLTSIRGAPEVSSCRRDLEEREDSPAQIVGYPAIYIAEAAAAEGQENSMSGVLPKLVMPATESFYNMLEKFRSLPPRSPTKGMRTMTPTTPPPIIGSPAYHHQVSPPRNIVDYSMESNVSRPYVVRTNPSTRKQILVSPGSHVRPITPLVCLPVGGPRYSPNQNRPLTTWPEQPSPYRSMATSGTYEEHNIEILKTDSRDELLGQRIATPEVDADAN